MLKPITPINNTFFDSRDVIEYLDFLKEKAFELFIDFAKEDLTNVIDEETLDDLNDYDEAKEYFDLNDFSETKFNDMFSDVYSDEIKEIEDLEKFIGDLEEYSSEVNSGTTIISEEYFTDFIEQDLEDLGYIPKDFPYWIVIDYEATANHLKQDYAEVYYDDETFLVRCD